MKGKKKILPAILMAGAMAVPNAAMASQLAKTMTIAAPDGPASRLVTDSQAAYHDGSVRKAVQPDWAEVTWAEVVWARVSEENRG